MKVFVTGASGFVGKILCAELLNKGHEVSAGVRRPGSAPPGTTEVLVGEIDGSTDWSSALKGHEAVVHLAARVHVMTESAADPLAEFRRVNSFGTGRLAEQSSAAGVKRFVFLSSIKVNGEKTTAKPFTVNDAANPLDPYGISKFEAEQAIERVADEADTQFSIIRTPLVYGPGVGGNFLRLMKIVQKGVPIPLMAAVNSRSMISVWNLCDLINFLVQTDQPGVQLILASDAESLSTPELVRTIGLGLRRRARLFWVPIFILRLAGRLLRKSSEIDRLVGSLEIETGSNAPGFEWSPPQAVLDGVVATSRNWESFTENDASLGQSHG